MQSDTSMIACFERQLEEAALVVSGSPVGASLPQMQRLAQRLAQQAAFVVAVDSGAEVLAAAGLTPHLLLGDFDSIRPEVLEEFKAQGVELQTHDTYKDATDLELALAEVLKRGYRTVVATNVCGGRVDHELSSLGCLAGCARQGACVYIIEPTEASVILCGLPMPTSEAGEGAVMLAGSALAKGVDRRAAGEAGDPQMQRPRQSGIVFDFSERGKPSFISLIPWGGDATVSIRGVEWELDHATLNCCGSRGVSNVPLQETTEVAVEAHAGTVIVVLEA